MNAACGPALRSVLVVGCALALTLVFVPAASANPVPNPGFEVPCGPIDSPCSWEGGDRDLDNPHSGSASLRIYVNELTVIDRASSDCVSMNIAAGPQTFSLWYRTGDTRINSVAGFVYFFTDTACSSGAGPLEYIDQAAIANGTWQPAFTTVQVPANVQSVSFTLGAAGGVEPGGQPAPINFDDISLGSPTAVAVTTFTALRRPGGVHLAWRSASEVEVLGYRVLRAGPQDRRAVVRGLVRAATGAGSASYRVVDRSASSAVSYRYFLQAVRFDGSRQIVRSVRIAAG